MTRRSAAPAAATAAERRRWGLDPAWSRHVEVRDRHGVEHRWHVLDTGEPDDGTTGPFTLVCVHGNPTWSVLWRSFLERFGTRCRVVAPDQLGMGYSDRTDAPRSYADRVADLDDLVRAVGVAGPIVLVGHDWGGAVAMGWAVHHGSTGTRDERWLAAMVLANTGIAVPRDRSAPAVIRLAATPGVHDLATRRTSLFVRGTGWLSRGRLTATERRALAAPYRRRAHRTAIGDFVADIPFSTDHPSAAPIDDVAQRLGELDVPVLLAWGGRDPVFDDDFAADLLDRLPRADLHRFPDAGHLVVAETASPTRAARGASVAEVAEEWMAARVVGAPADPADLPTDAAPASGPGGTTTATRSIDDVRSDWRPVWAALDERALGDGREEVAFRDDGSGTSASFVQLQRMVDGIAAGLARRGVSRGDRVAVLVPPSVELVALVYACWRIGAITVIADRGLGLGGLGRAVRGARVRHLVGPRRALVAARSLRWAPSAASIALRDVVVMTGSSPRPADLPEPPGPDELAAVLFTSGATGPAKGVQYTHRRLAGQRDALTELYDIGPDDRFVAAFAPFALFGPALGITSAVPDVDVTTPGELTAAALDRACASVEATMVFASPAALANVARTADGPLGALARVRTVMSAGAPVPVRTLRAIAALAPHASLHTPYGMTEALPVADIDLATLEALGAGRGVCVGAPVPGCDVMIAPLGGTPEPLPVDHTGEALVASPWMSTGYDGLWATQHRARPLDAGGRRWHRSGDVGHLDGDGRLWIEGRAVHVIAAVDGPVTPVPIEVAVESLDGVDRAAAVGVGPAGVQQLVVVVESGAGDGLADPDLARRVREVVAPRPVAAVCTWAALPVDIRHNAKIDRTAVAAWAERLLAGASGPDASLTEVAGP